MNNPLTQIVPARLRRYVYALYAAIGIAFGAVQVGFATAGENQPTALLVGFAVFGYLGTALGLVAASNTAAPESDIALDIDALDDGNDIDGHGYHEAPYSGE